MCDGDRMRDIIIVTFGVPNENGKVIEFFAERGLCIGNTYFKHKSKYKWRESFSMIDLVLVR